MAAAARAADLEVDVCILGAGVIGLCTALALLRADAGLRVALLDQSTPCAGATGAGQGYLWMAHRSPSSPLWQFAQRSKQMWQVLLATVPQLTPAALEWQAAGSMLLASTAEDEELLHQRLQLLRSAGLADARLAPAAMVRQLEPALSRGAAESALLVDSDVQLNGRAAAAALLQACKTFGNRFVPLFNESVSSLVLPGTSRRVEAVQTEARRIGATLGVVVALGAWSGPFLAAQLADGRWAHAIQPRRGVLLEMPLPPGMAPLQRGLMEVGYAKHYSLDSRRASGGWPDIDAHSHVSVADITFTACTSASGSLLIGSSREFAGFDSSAPEAIVQLIMQRAIEFLPALAAVNRWQIAVRAGPRPYAAAGFPMVGAVPGVPGLLLAAGHEGSGLLLAPATAAVICEQLLGCSSGLDAAVVDSLRVKVVQD